MQQLGVMGQLVEPGLTYWASKCILFAKQYNGTMQYTYHHGTPPLMQVRRVLLAAVLVLLRKLRKSLLMLVKTTHKESVCS